MSQLVLPARQLQKAHQQDKLHLLWMGLFARACLQAFSNAGYTQWLYLSVWFITWHYAIMAVLVVGAARRAAGEHCQQRQIWSANGQRISAVLSCNTWTTLWGQLVAVAVPACRKLCLCVYVCVPEVAGKWGAYQYAERTNGHKQRSPLWVLSIPLALPGVVALDLLMLLTTVLPLLSRNGSGSGISSFLSNYNFTRLFLDSCASQSHKQSCRCVWWPASFSWVVLPHVWRQ